MASKRSESATAIMHRLGRAHVTMCERILASPEAGIGRKRLARLEAEVKTLRVFFDRKDAKASPKGKAEVAKAAVETPRAHGGMAAWRLAQRKGSAPKASPKGKATPKAPKASPKGKGKAAKVADCRLTARDASIRLTHGTYTGLRAADLAGTYVVTCTPEYVLLRGYRDAVARLGRKVGGGIEGFTN